MGLPRDAGHAGILLVAQTTTATTLQRPCGAAAEVTSFEPFTLLTALAAVTDRIGFVAAASTTFEAPHHLARRLSSLDHISNGRAAWNIVTISNPDAAKNFELEDHADHGERYERACEFCDVVTGLWATSGERVE